MSSNAAFSMNKFFQLCNLIQGQAQVIRNIFSRLHLFGTISHILILPFGATNRKLLLEDCPPSTPPLPPPPFRLQFLSLGFCRVVFFFSFPKSSSLLPLGLQHLEMNRLLRKSLDSYQVPSLGILLQMNSLAGLAFVAYCFADSTVTLQSEPFHVNFWKLGFIHCAGNCLTFKCRNLHLSVLNFLLFLLAPSSSCHKLLVY